ncbi:hypothetical protein [Rubrivirga sp.]|uniref:hypothetical protein n=1 Tax=Rubrivirga sp. TaxID=1885344 RepID=UPI003C717031
MRVLLLVLLSAAVAAQTPARIEGEQSDLDAFVGEWVGGYTCAGTGRHGTIVFRLAAGDDSLRAAVLMVPRPTEDDLVPDAVPLAVHYVSVEGRAFQGSLERYDDPEHGVPLETEFGGMIDRDGHIEGYFRGSGTRVDTVPLCGRWWATRTVDRQATRAPRP